ncbi:bestrophin family protein [Maribacter sp. 1_MG-2023]|uniref:bestrophin family protein n=1 Tax=Maribacter sp. 1_MG-2023 TaxID=3062677 RepID=UPI0026E24D29|nr:bestrophin family ion channel [Maribacter sp. 1_MG-2023]MDO6472749.1 bestrophin family ion channel [Maribacter sp. 1_MG-2023]
MIIETRIPIKYILGIAKGDLLRIIPLSLILTTYTEVYHFTFDIPFSIPAVLGTAISLVLSFKLSQSYDRWWEARKIWGAIVNDSRNLVVQLKNFCSQEDHKLIALISMRQISWCYALEQHLRHTYNIKVLEAFLSQDDKRTVNKGKHRPLVLIDLIGKDIKSLYHKGLINSYQQITLFNTLEKLVDSMGQAERIKNTIFPILYRLFLKLFIYSYIIILAIALSELDYYYEFPLLIVLTMPFVMLEKTAFLLQDPFENRPNDTAMTTICRAIESNIKELINEPEDQTDTAIKEDFYIL